MGRKRVIDTDRLYFDSELVRLLGAEGLHVYIRLWGIAEDWGGYKANYDDISLQTGALRITPQKIEEYTKLLIKTNHLIPYLVDGREYHWIKNFMEYQPLSNPSPPKLPLPPWINCEIKKYKSGKKYAKYSIIQEKLPVDYQYPTGSLPVDYQYPTGSLPVDYQYPTGSLPVALETETETETETRIDFSLNKFKEKSQPPAEAPDGDLPFKIPKKKNSKKSPKGKSHFSEKAGSFFEPIKTACDQILKLPPKNGKPFNPFQWVQYHINKNAHPGAINETIQALVKFWPDIREGPWNYGNAVLLTKNQNWNEKDAIAASEAFKAEWDICPEIKNLIGQIGRDVGG